MKKIIISLFLVISITTNIYSNSFEETPPKLIAINGKLYKEKNGVLFPLIGIVIKWVVPMIIGEIKERALNYVTEMFNEKDIKILPASDGNRDDVEVITLNGQDNDEDGNFEFSSESEDHNNDGVEDNETELTEFENMENGLEQVLNNQLNYIDQFYEGDVDGDGTEE